MIHDAKVEVTCDGKDCTGGPRGKCEASIYVDLHAGTRDSYIADDASIERGVVDEGWTVVDGKHYCEDCAEGADA